MAYGDQNQIDILKNDLLRSRGQSMAFWQSQSVEFDQRLEIRTKLLENEISSVQNLTSMWEQQPWHGLPEGVLQTPYGEFFEIIERVGTVPGQKWIDLGAGYGRLGIVLAAVAPDVQFVGYEFVTKRAAEAQRVYEELNLKNSKMIEQDLKADDFTPEVADVYFLYDFGSRLAVEKILADLKNIAKTQKITVVARGRGCRNWIERGHPWLAEVNEPERFHYYNIYRS